MIVPLFRIFWRARDRSILFITTHLALALYWGYHLRIFLRHRALFPALESVFQPNIFIVALFIYCFYNLARTLRDHSLDESFKTTKYGLARVYAGLVGCLLVISTIPFVLYLMLSALFYALSGLDFDPVLIHLIKTCILYSWLSFLIAGLLGIVFGSVFGGRRLAVYGLTVGLILLNTTFTEVPFRIPLLLFGSSWTENLLYSIKDFVRLVPHEIGNAFAVPDIYGFPLEPVRWGLALFWMVFSLALIGYTAARSRQVKNVLLAATIVTASVAVVLFSYRGSTLAMDRRMQSFPYADPIYYMGQDEPDSQRLEPGFQVEAYDMKFTISNELRAEVRVTLDNPDLDRYDFTLYHGYIITDVHTETGKVRFIRDGDYVTVGPLAGARTVTFRYHGKSPKYYANAQAITLPGYFAYYPKPGRLKIWDSDRYGYVINLSSNESEYTVKVRSNLKVFSNLDGHDNVFAGRTNGLSLFAGLDDEVENGIYAEPTRNDRPTRECLRRAEHILDRVYTELEQPMPALIRGFSEKKFFQVPRSFGLNSNTEDVVIMSDHVTAQSCGSGAELARSIIMTQFQAGVSAENFRFVSQYVDYLVGIPEGAPVDPSARLDPAKILSDIQEVRRLRQQSASSTESGPSAESMRQEELAATVLDQAARYLFLESPQKTKHRRRFYDHLTSGEGGEPLDFIERALREELGE
ncbi:hypothetical protein [Thermaerobacter subterraneus]|uniref:ABC-type transport system involved in cytochrome c biogenesis, permease component n=1 Tax=Thermaerobacter subterraneus DSM 13965 TaxID=867903 RepID=K6QEK8_9FIRM|nr:hypothetical protein [Thermaerobacter subterraneus]EKP95301.1 ABC-type transport system involved in cytochrome c biogenesis, permease component [Thermaerobacter subterraneus DSM 13965]